MNVAQTLANNFREVQPVWTEEKVPADFLRVFIAFARNISEDSCTFFEDWEDHDKILSLTFTDKSVLQIHNTEQREEPAFVCVH